MLAEQLDARVRDRLANEDSHTCTGCSYASTARRHRDAALDVGAELGERQLDGRERRPDVEDVEVADVADAEDLPLQRPLAGRERDAVSIAQQEQQLAGVDALGRADGGHDRGAVVVGREELEPHGLDPFAAGAAESNVMLERRLETLFEQEAERDVETDDERDGRRERRVEDLLRLARPLPVEVEARQRPARVPGAPARPRRPRGPGGVISAFCEPETTTSMPHSSVSSGTAPRLETASTTETAPASRAAAARLLHVGDDAGRRLAVRQQDDARLALGEPRREIVGDRRLAPLVFETVDLAAVRLGDLRPAVAERAAGDDADPLAGRAEVGDGRLHRRRCRWRRT